jgi:dipeptidyl aminopeptidase/acylaminoacyl peptidase
MMGSRQFLPDERIYLWDTTGGKLLHVLTGVRGVATNLALSPDGRMLAVTYAPQGFSDILEERMRNAVYLWEVASGRPRGRLEGHGEAVSCVAWSPDGRFLVSGSEDSTLLVWDMSDPLASKRPRDGVLTAKELTDLWEDLSGLDAEKAYRAIGRLAGSPGQAVAFLRERLRPVPPADPARLRKLLADLDDRRFAVRRRAANELEAMQETAAPALREFLKGKPVLEYRRRVERLLGRLEASVPPPDRLREMRAVEVLEVIGTSEACRLLQALTRGAPEVRLTREARGAVRRLTARAARR